VTSAEFLSRFEAFSRNGGGRPQWLLPLREGAMERFSAEGFPRAKDEDWRFTSLKPITEGNFPPLEAPPVQPSPEDLDDFLIGHPEWPVAIFVNGRLAPELSRLNSLPQGVRILGLAEAWSEAPELVKPHLAQTAPVTGSAFTALNTAFMADGALIRLAADAVLEQPIHLIYLTDATAAAGMSSPRTLVVLDSNAKAQVIESYVSLGEGRYFTNAITEVVLGPGARLEHYKIQREDEKAYHVGTIEARQERDSHFESLSFALGAELSRTNIYTVLGGEGSHVTMNGLYVGHGSQHIDHQTRIDHAEPNCTSWEMYKGILDDRSHAVFNGKVFVRPEAQKTDGKQTNRTLLLSDQAKVDTKPQLEIFADDVKCTHGATVGQLEAQALFYCRSRGLSEQDARTLLTYAFAADVLEQIPNHEIAADLERLVMRRFLGHTEDVPA